jgi:streptogramin lyase
MARAGTTTWVVDRFADSISVLSADDGRLLTRLELHAGALAAGVDAVWMVDDLADRVRRVDLRTNRETGAADLPPASGPSDIVLADAALWVAASRSGTVLRLDPSTLAPVGSPVAVEGVRALAAAAGSVWAASQQQDQLTRIEAASGRVMARVDVCDAPVALAANAQGAWVVCAIERALWQVSPSGQVLWMIALDGVPTDVALAADRVWVTLRGS